MSSTRSSIEGLVQAKYEASIPEKSECPTWFLIQHPTSELWCGWTRIATPRKSYASNSDHIRAMNELSVPIGVNGWDS